MDKIHYPSSKNVDDRVQKIVDEMVLLRTEGMESRIIIPKADDKYLCDKINELAAKITVWREDKGFDSGSDNLPEKLMLIVSELAEAMEELRNPRIWQRNNYVYFVGDKPDGFAIELIDALIRLLDLCAALRIDVASGLALKMNFNAGRPYKHDKQF